MSWLFSQALVAEYSAANSSDGAPSAPSNTTPTPQAFLWRDKTTDAWSRFPSGLTCEPLMDDRGEGLLKSFLAGFHAPTYQPREKAPELKERAADCGETWSASLAKWDRATSSWKTRQCLLFEDSTESLETLPSWGSMRAGELLALEPLELFTEEAEFGLLATPTARDWKDCGTKTAPPSRQKHSEQTLGQQLGVKIGLAPQPAFAEWMMAWPSGWTDLKPLATDKFQQWLRSHGVSSADQQHKEAA
jgi:hypothetical protein